MQILEAHIQTLTLVVLAFTAIAIVWQAIEARTQAKASEKLAQLGLDQTKLMRIQALASFRPIITVTHGTYGLNVAMLTLKNLGTGAALGIVGIYRSGFRQRVGSLSAEEATSFQFDNSLNRILRPVGPPITEGQSVRAANGDVALRLEYQSVSGANCWTTVQFRLGGEGAFEVDEIKHGMDSPSLVTNL